ncbi:hypothetical protein C8Q76DRAFT_737358 [Earliella scabrosa]|nr:hypothetical protein C8Q76DRAFT_737358 [Earliella scabrosa]
MGLCLDCVPALLDLPALMFSVSYVPYLRSRNTWDCPASTYTGMTRAGVVRDQVSPATMCSMYIPAHLSVNYLAGHPRRRCHPGASLLSTVVGASLLPVHSTQPCQPPQDCSANEPRLGRREALQILVTAEWPSLAPLVSMSAW